MSDGVQTLTLYEVLGVSEQASPADIKAAHREAVKRHHPDVGGSAADFENVQRAYFVLSDPDRRARYDQTGIEDDSPAAAEEQLAHSAIATIIVQFVTSSDDLAKTDIIAICKAKLRQRKEMHETAGKQIEKHMHRVSVVRERLHHKEGGGDAFSALLAERERELRASSAKEQQHIRVTERALAMLEDYTYRVDPSPIEEAQIWAALKGSPNTSKNAL